MEQEGLAGRVLERLHLPNTEPDLHAWKELVERVKRPSRQVTVAIVGKYVMLSDAYISVVESLKHAGARHSCQVNIKWVLSEDVEKHGAKEYLTDVDGILVPGGFGDRGIEGKIMAAEFARTQKIPYLSLPLCKLLLSICSQRGQYGQSSLSLTPNHLPVIDLMPISTTSL
jgi:CTP synthase